MVGALWFVTSCGVRPEAFCFLYSDFAAVFMQKYCATIFIFLESFIFPLVAPFPLKVNYLMLLLIFALFLKSEIREAGWLWDLSVSTSIYSLLLIGSLNVEPWIGVVIGCSIFQV